MGPTLGDAACVGQVDHAHTHPTHNWPKHQNGLKQQNHQGQAHKAKFHTTREVDSPTSLTLVLENNGVHPYEELRGTGFRLDDPLGDVGGNRRWVAHPLQNLVPCVTESKVRIPDVVEQLPHRGRVAALTPRVLHRTMAQLCVRRLPGLEVFFKPTARDSQLFQGRRVFSRHDLHGDLLTEHSLPTRKVDSATVCLLLNQKFLHKHLSSDDQHRQRRKRKQVCQRQSVGYARAVVRLPHALLLRSHPA